MEAKTYWKKKAIKSTEVFLPWVLRKFSFLFLLVDFFFQVKARGNSDRKEPMQRPCERAHSTCHSCKISSAAQEHEMASLSHLQTQASYGRRNDV